MIDVLAAQAGEDGTVAGAEGRQHLPVFLGGLVYVTGDHELDPNVRLDRTAQVELMEAFKDTGHRLATAIHEQMGTAA